MLIMKKVKKEYERKNLSFYEVPLTCHIVSHIGCGSRSKPVLIDLLNFSSVRKTWLNRTGALIALEWGNKIYPNRRKKIISNVFLNYDLSSTEVIGRKYDECLQSFKISKNWLTASEVDELERFPLETVEKMVEAGIMGIPFPEKYGGEGGDYIGYVIAVEELSKALNVNYTNPDTGRPKDSSLPTNGQSEKANNLYSNEILNESEVRNRNRMLEKVYNFWIKGVLDNSLHGVALIDLGMDEKRDAVNHQFRC